MKNVIRITESKSAIAALYNCNTTVIVGMFISFFRAGLTKFGTFTQKRVIRIWSILEFLKSLSYNDFYELCNKAENLINKA